MSWEGVKFGVILGYFWGHFGVDFRVDGNKQWGSRKGSKKGQKWPKIDQNPGKVDRNSGNPENTLVGVSLISRKWRSTGGPLVKNGVK
jgi:hypothetical protein